MQENGEKKTETNDPAEKYGRVNCFIAEKNDVLAARRFLVENAGLEPVTSCV